jgi:ABC-type lipoprotein export system ATPase subunit
MSSVVGKKIVKEFGPLKLRVLHEIDINIASGEFVSISGKSGSGKSTLLYILSTLDDPSSGIVELDGVDVNSMNSNELHAFRNHRIGFIFQFHYLLSELTVLENILLPARNANVYQAKVAYAHELLEKLGIKEKKDQRPSELSGGQQQRVAIARSLIMSPQFIFADEPTGNLDSKNANIVIEMLRETNKRDGTTVVLVTHDPDFAASAKREIVLVDGRIEGL